MARRLVTRWHPRDQHSILEYRQADRSEVDDRGRRGREWRSPGGYSVAIQRRNDGHVVAEWRAGIRDLLSESCTRQRPGLGGRWTEVKRLGEAGFQDPAFPRPCG